MTATGSALPNMIGSDAVWSLLLASVSSPCAIPVSGGANRRRAAITTRTVRRDTGPITRRSRPTGRPAPHSQGRNWIGPFACGTPFAADSGPEHCPRGKGRKLRERSFPCSRETNCRYRLRRQRRPCAARPGAAAHAFPRPPRTCFFPSLQWVIARPAASRDDARRCATMRFSLPTALVQRELLLGLDPAPTIADGILDRLVHCAIRRGQDGS